MGATRHSNARTQRPCRRRSSAHLGLNTLAEMGATPRGHYTVVADMSAAGRGPGGVIQSSSDSDSSCSDMDVDAWGEKTKT